MKTRLIATLAFSFTALVVGTTTSMADPGKPLPKNLTFEKKIAPDFTALLALFSRFTPETCEYRPAPTLEELTIHRDAQEGAIIDAGVVMARNLECDVPSRMILYRADADFEGADVIVIEDEQTNSIVEVTYEKYFEYKDLPKDWDAIDRTDHSATHRELTHDAYDIIGYFPTTPPEGCSSEYPDLYAPDFADLVLQEAPEDATFSDGGLGYKIFSDECDVKVRVVLYKTSSTPFEEEQVVIYDPKNNQKIEMTYTYTDQVRDLPPPK